MSAPPALPAESADVNADLDVPVLDACLGCRGAPGPGHRRSAACWAWPTPVPPRPISNQRYRFYDWCRRADVPEVAVLAQTIEAWWAQLLAFLGTGITNAATESTNRLVKDAARVVFGFRNPGGQRRRIRLHCKRKEIDMSA